MACTPQTSSPAPGPMWLSGWSGTTSCLHHTLKVQSNVPFTPGSLEIGGRVTSCQHLYYDWLCQRHGSSALLLTWTVRLLLVFRTFFSASWKAFCSLCSIVWANLQDWMLSAWLTNWSTRMRAINQHSPKRCLCSWDLTVVRIQNHTFYIRAIR